MLRVTRSYIGVSSPTSSPHVGDGGKEIHAT